MDRKHVENAFASLRLALADEPAEPAWLHTARGELGVKELPGSAHSERVLEYLDVCRKDEGGNLGDWGAGRDETPWCSAFVNWCLLRAGIEGTRNAAARSWLKWGDERELTPGCVVVLSRDGGGHVGFFVKRTENNGVLLLGGNQGDRVSMRQYPRSRALAYLMPA